MLNKIRRKNQFLKGRDNDIIIIIVYISLTIFHLELDILTSLKIKYS